MYASCRDGAVVQFPCWLLYDCNVKELSAAKPDRHKRNKENSRGKEHTDRTWEGTCLPVCFLSFTHMASIRMRNVITNESVRESGVPQLAWHLAWHIVARPRPLPARSNVAVDKPIKKPLLNALSLLLFHAL